jgi:hypothetical protein
MSRVSLVLVVLTVVAVCGCGAGDGATRYAIAGNVTFAGKPIPTGKIYFTPDGAKGNTGAAGYADIKEGKYDTSKTGGMGNIGGAMLVRIEGADGVPLDEDRPSGTPLFTFYETAVELPKENTTKDFDVPAAAASAQAPTAPPLVVP